MSVEHSGDCDSLDRNPDGIIKPCNCGAEHHAALRTFKKSKILALIAYDVEAPDGRQIQVALTDLAAGMLSTLTDFELKVFAAETSLIVRHAFEMPPSPTPKPK